MSALASRRTVLGGLAVAPLLSAPALAAGPHPDAELLRLASAYGAAHHEHDAALVEWRSVHARYEATRPARPNALRRRADFHFFYGWAGCNPHSPDFYQSGEVAEFFRGYTPPETTLCPKWRERQARRAREIVAAQDAWNAECERHAERTGYAEIERRCDEIADRCDDLGERVRGIRATTFEGIAAKARVAKALGWYDFESEVTAELIAIAGGAA